MADAILKRCTRCGASKPIAAFPLCRGKPRARCKPCHTADATAWAQQNHEAYKKRLSAWHFANIKPRFMGPPLPRHIAAERMRASGRKYRAKYPERNKASQAKWLKENRHVAMEVVRRRQAAKLRATPAWANRKAMQAVYAEALRLASETGIPRDVDHIVPLISSLVCGLHCEANLQVLARKENRMKHNSYWPDMWDVSAL